MVIGRWPSALLRFLASKREITQTLLSEGHGLVVSLLSCKRRRVGAQPVLAVSSSAAQRLAMELQPVLCFVRHGLSKAVEATVPSSAARRAELYVDRREGPQDPAKQRVARAMQELVELMDTLKQLLHFTEILQKSGCRGLARGRFGRETAWKRHEKAIRREVKHSETP